MKNINQYGQQKKITRDDYMGNIIGYSGDGNIYIIDKVIKLP
jgi:hypothetical protein